MIIVVDSLCFDHKNTSGSVAILYTRIKSISERRSSSSGPSNELIFIEGI